MIYIKNLMHIHLGGRRVLDDVCMRITPARLCVLAGVNGAGKSTLFRIVCGLTRPTAGQVMIDGLDSVQDAHAVRQKLGVVFQNPAVDKRLSVRENLHLHATLYGIRGQDFKSKLERVLAWSDVRHRLDDKVGILSGGLARQVELVKALLTEPKVLLLDEPTTGLDPASRHYFLAALRQQQAEYGVSVLMTSHLLSETGDADQLVILHQGKVLADADPVTLKKQRGQDIVVIEARDGQALEKLILADTAAIHHNIPLQRLGNQLRLAVTGHAEALAFMEKMMTTYRETIKSISLREPDLEDVFIHITGGETSYHNAEGEHHV